MGVDNPATPAAEVEGTTLRTVYIATTRQRSDDDTILFTADRNPVGLGFAKAVVSIPPNRQPGAVVRPARLPPNPKREFVILDPVVFADDRSFANDLDVALSQRPPSQREVLVFIHGYNTDLPASIMRMAQIVEDTGFSGIPIVFSWPSRGQLFQYGYDLNSALHARDELTQTVELVAATRTTGMNFVSHSMGNILAVEAMRQDQMTNNFNKSGKISSIVLAAPDIDVELFAKQLRAFPEGSRNFYILVSKDDQALALSRSLAGGVTRVGAADAERLSELGVTVIDLTKVDDQSDLNHSKFASATEFVQLIGGWLNETDAFREPDADSLAER
ncbi:MAG: alpha/beta hydrolase, partial [Pseudomonadota bacterium]